MKNYLLWLYRGTETRLETYPTFERAKNRGEWCKASTNVHFHFDNYKIEEIKKN